MSVHQHKDGRWFCTYYEDGKKKFKYFGRGDIAEHQALKHDEEVRSSKGKIKSACTLTVGHICHEYHLNHFVEQSTGKSDAYRLNSTILPLLGDLPADALDSDKMNEYVQKRLKAGKKLRTIDREVDILRSAYNWAVSKEPPLILRNPILKYRVPAAKDSYVPVPPTSEEIKSILRHAAPHLARAIIIEWYCGMRPGGEVSRILWGDIDLENNELRVISARKGGPVVRYVPLSAPLREHLVKWREADEAGLDKEKNIQQLPVVHYRFRQTLSLRHGWEIAKKKAGITRRLRLYDLRHAMASMALRNGADLKAISELIGHSRPDTTLNTYQHVTREQHREAVDKIPDLDLTTTF